MEISAKDVAKLRGITGAGMMDCKKALAEAEGDFDAAIEILRKKGQKVANNRSDREASEGAVFVKTLSAGEAIMIELNCETDFVARNEDFQALGNTILEVAAANKPANAEALKALPLADGRAINDHLTDAMGKIGEKIDVSKYAHITGESVVTYIHPGARIGVAVAFAGASGDTDTIGKDVAMQIAAMSPVAVTKDDVDPSIIQKEIEIGMEIARQEGKPEAMLEKIAQGKLNKFFEDSTLLNQKFVKDSSKTVAQYIKETLGASATVKSFRRFQLGQN